MLFNGLLSLCILMLKLFQIWTVVAPSSWPCPSDMFQACIFPARALGLVISSSYEGWSLETKIWVPGMLTAIGMVLLPGLLLLPQAKSIYMNTHTHTQNT